jgi:hypothetical protein
MKGSQNASSAGTAFSIFCKFFVSRTRDQFRQGAIMPPGCCGWSLVHTSRVSLNCLHVCCLATCMWLVLLLSALCAFFVTFSVTDALSKQALALQGGSSEVRLFFRYFQVLPIMCLLSGHTVCIANRQSDCSQPASVYVSH